MNASKTCYISLKMLILANPWLEAKTPPHNFTVFTTILMCALFLSSLSITCALQLYMKHIKLHTFKLLSYELLFCFDETCLEVLKVTITSLKRNYFFTACDSAALYCGLRNCGCSVRSLPKSLPQNGCVPIEICQRTM